MSGSPLLPFTVFALGDAQLHQLHTPQGKLFVMGECAVELFQETPVAFLQELRKGRYMKVNSQNREVLHTVAELGLPVESTTGGAGISLLPAATIEALLIDRRRMEMVQPLKLALLKLASQEAARLMAAGEYEKALPVALDAVKQGQALFSPGPALQLFPLYLLAAQANLGLKRTRQCDDFLGLASWLAMKDPDDATHIMKSQLSRLYGQLYALQGKYAEGLEAFAEDIYYCSLEYGPRDVRTSLGYYNLGKIFQSQEEKEKSLACFHLVVSIWTEALRDHVVSPELDLPNLPVGKVQLIEVVDMLQDIATWRAEVIGPDSTAVGDAHLTTSMVLAYLGDNMRSREMLETARKMIGDDDEYWSMVIERLDAITSLE